MKKYILFILVLTSCFYKQRIFERNEPPPPPGTEGETHCGCDTIANEIEISQPAESLDIPSNSFQSNYRKSNSTLIYSYDDISQTHNYSNNWDFDKDGIMDELYFIGTGGAHLYYFLKVVLSTDKKSREFNFIQTDFPFLTATDTINIEKTVFGFVVADLGKNLTPTIIVRLDEQTFNHNKELKKRNIKTKNVLISFENGKTKFGSL